MKCGCRGNASSSSSSIPVPSNTPTPTQDAMATTSNILFPTSTMEVTPTPVRTFLSPTRLPAGTGTNTKVVATEDAEQATPIGIIVGGSIGGVILVAGVVSMFLCERGDSQRRVGHIRHSPKGEHICIYLIVIHRAFRPCHPSPSTPLTLIFPRGGQ